MADFTVRVIDVPVGKLEYLLVRCADACLCFFVIDHQVLSLVCLLVKDRMSSE
jgi:hypothetical protein